MGRGGGGGRERDRRSAAVARAARERGRARAVRCGSFGDDDPRRARRALRGGPSGTHARKRRLGRVLRCVRRRRGDSRTDRAAHGCRRMARLARARGERGVRAHRRRAIGAWRARNPRGDAMKTWRHRGHAAYWAFLVHRVSGLALALFLPLHFTALAQALQGEAALEGFLRWTKAPLVEASEVALVFLLAAHPTGRLRLPFTSSVRCLCTTTK